MPSLNLPPFTAERPRVHSACGVALALIAVGTLGVCPPANTTPLPWPADAQAAEHAASSRVTVDNNPQLFATMCALYAAGFEEDVSAVGFHPVRARLRELLRRQQGPATEAVRKFFNEHELRDPAVTLSPYVSFALVVGSPPKFQYLLRRDELPPDVLPLEGFNELLANFYREAQIDRLWSHVQHEYDREIGRLQEPVANLVLTSSAYLREIVRPASPRTFTVYVEPLVGAKTNFRNYGNHYAIVVSPGAELPLDEIRHAFLHYLLDPLPYRYGGLVSAKKPLLELAARAPRLPRQLTEDFTAFFTECLVQAVELRLRRVPPQKLTAAIDEAEADGYVLVRPLAGELVNFEKAEPAMRYYFPDLVRAIDVNAELQRLKSVQFTAATQSAEAGAHGAKAAHPSELAQWLAEGEQQIAANDGAGAAATFHRVLAKYPEQPRALYGLAVAAALQGDKARAKELFHHLVGGAPGGPTGVAVKDPVILAWSHVYLGRIYDVERNRELALSEYRAALAVQDAPESARLAARRGIEKGFEPVRD